MKKKNLCGKCNVCCVIYDIDKKYLSWRDTNKEKGEVCDKYINNRCVRYSLRPKPCKDFECLFLKLLNMNAGNPEWRPDKIGFIIKLGFVDGKQAFMIEEIEQGSLNFNNITKEQDKFLRATAEISEKNKCLLLIRPFGHDHQYPLRFHPTQT